MSVASHKVLSCFPQPELLDRQPALKEANDANDAVILMTSIPPPVLLGRSNAATAEECSGLFRRAVPIVRNN
jgi:hypothetical protein